MQGDLLGHVVRVWLLAILDVAGNILKCPSELTIEVPALPPGGFGNRPQIVVRLKRDARRDGFGQVVNRVAVGVSHRVDQGCSPRRHVHTAFALKVWVKLIADHAVLAGIGAFTAGRAASRRASAQREQAEGADRLHEMIPVDGADAGPQGGRHVMSTDVLRVFYFSPRWLSESQFSVMFSQVSRWGGWGSNPRPADY